MVVFIYYVIITHIADIVNLYERFLNDFFVKEKNAAITRFLRLRRICFYL